MNVYDFDNTIYDGDSSIDFFLFCIKKNPKTLMCILKQIKGLVLYKMGYINKKKFKEYFFSFLLLQKDCSSMVKSFWDNNEKKIKKWYLEGLRLDDVIISASPEFLLTEICERIHIHNLIATCVDSSSGYFLSENCYGEEKVHRFLNAFPCGEIDNFYSDSYSDMPLAKLASASYIVKKDLIIKWNIQ